MSDDIESQARGMGWHPQEEWKGDPERWVDAETFVKRGEEVLPILRANNKKLESQLAESTARVQRLETLFGASQETIEALKNAGKENALAAAKQARAQLLQELKEARNEGDVVAEEAINDQLVEIRQTIAEASKPEPEVIPQSTAPQIDPALVEWAKNNTWFGADQRKTARFMGAANMLRSDPANDHIVGAAFYKAVDEYLEQQTRPTSGKASSGTPSGSPASGPGKKAYKDLPQDAKEACARQGRKLVGEGRAFKTEADWNEAYAKTYFSQE